MKLTYESEAAHATIQSMGVALGLEAAAHAAATVALATDDRDPLIGADEVLAFWEVAGPAQWFAQDPAFDSSFRENFLHLHKSAARGQLEGWLRTANSALALVLLLDQFPRNAFRHTPRMYTTDTAARAVATAAIAAGFDHAVATPMQIFFYLPFAHSEDLDDQQRSVRLCMRVGGIALEHAERHRHIIRRFGRFPHRNPILGRDMTDPEQAYLDGGGFKG